VPELLKRLDPNFGPGDAGWRPMRNALLALRALGPAAKDAAVAVAGLLDTPRKAQRRMDPGWAPWAADALAAMGPPGAAAAGKALTAVTDRRPRLGSFGQEQAMRLLGRMGAQARPAGAELVKLLGDRDLRLRLRAAEVLGRVDAELARRQAVPALVEMADPRDDRSRQNTRFRAEVVAVLGRLGALAAGAAPRLKKIAEENDADLRAAAEAALRAVAVETFVAPAGATAPTALPGDRVAVDKTRCRPAQTLAACPAGGADEKISESPLT
jgi:HEAT repeat protein